MALHPRVDFEDALPIGVATRRRLEGSGFSPEIAATLAREFPADDAQNRQLPEPLATLERVRQASPSDAAAIIVVLATQVPAPNHEDPDGPWLDPLSVPALPTDLAAPLGRCLQALPRADIKAAFQQVVAKQHAFNVTGPAAAHVLLHLQLVEPAEFISWDAVLRAWPGRGLVKSGHGSNEQDMENADASSLVFWLVTDRVHALQAATEHLRNVPDQELAAHASAVCFAVSTALWRPERGRIIHFNTYRERKHGFAEGTAGIHAVLLERYHAAPVEFRAGLVPALLRTHWMAFDGREERLPDADRRFIVSLADGELGRLRGELRKRDPAEAAVLFQDGLHEFWAARRALFACGTLWKGIKPLLLLFRALKAPGVAPDLRWWDSHAARGAVPKPWNEISASLAFQFHAYAQREEAGDPELLGLRTEFGEFCLERLKSRPPVDGHPGGPMEPDPHWRLAYLRALEELHVNPKGRGHRTLHAVSAAEPDPDVQSEALRLSSVLRGSPRLPPRTSPRRAILMATLRLREGHLASLGVPVDVEGARLTAAEEIRRTTEREAAR